MGEVGADFAVVAAAASGGGCGSSSSPCGLATGVETDRCLDWKNMPRETRPRFLPVVSAPLSTAAALLRCCCARFAAPRSGVLREPRCKLPMCPRCRRGRGNGGGDSGISRRTRDDDAIPLIEPRREPGRDPGRDDCRSMSVGGRGDTGDAGPADRMAEGRPCPRVRTASVGDLDSGLKRFLNLERAGCCGCCGSEGESWG